MSETLEETIARIKSKWPEQWGLPRVKKDGEGAKDASIVPNTTIPEPRGKMKDSMDMEASDWKMKAADGEWDGAEDHELSGDSDA